MTRAQYEEETRDHTARELQKLREHLQRNQMDMMRLDHGRNMTVGFMQGNEHVTRTFAEARRGRLAGLGALLLQVSCHSQNQHPGWRPGQASAPNEHHPSTVA